MIAPVATAADLALERFDAAGAAFRAALQAAPADALGHRHAGDEYTVGGLVHHVDGVLRRYTVVAEAMIASGFDETSPADTSAVVDAANAQASATMTAAERDAAVAEVARLHDALRRLLAGVDAGEFGLQAPVHYGPGDPYPTRLVDVLGWLTDHYVEHTGQLAGLLAERRTLAAVEAFNAAFAAHDVDAVMARMTADCVFENTSPAPDGERLTGAEAVGAFWRQFFASTPSARFDAEETFAAGDRAVVRWTFTWDEGPENRGHVRGVDVFRVADDRVAEKLAYVKG